MPSFRPPASILTRDISFLPIGVGAQAVTSVRQKLVDGAVYWDAALAKFKFSGLDLRALPVPEDPALAAGRLAAGSQRDHQQGSEDADLASRVRSPKATTIR